MVEVGRPESKSIGSDVDRRAVQVPLFLPGGSCGKEDSASSQAKNPGEIRSDETKGKMVEMCLEVITDNVAFPMQHERVEDEIEDHVEMISSMPNLFFFGSPAVGPVAPKLPMRKNPSAVKGGLARFEPINWVNFPIPQVVHV